MTDRVPVPLAKAYRLMNHGPTVLVSSRHGDAVNMMAAAWSMPLDFQPPKVAVVLDKSTLTRRMVEASGEFALNVPSLDLHVYDAQHAFCNDRRPDVYNPEAAKQAWNYAKTSTPSSNPAWSSPWNQ